MFIYTSMIFCLVWYITSQCICILAGAMFLTTHALNLMPLIVLVIIQPLDKNKWQSVDIVQDKWPKIDASFSLQLHRGHVNFLLLSYTTTLPQCWTLYM